MTALPPARRIRGTVIDGVTGQPLANAPVRAILQNPGPNLTIPNATTDGKGHYSLQSPGTGAYLIRVTHQGANYFIAAPQGDVPGDVTCTVTEPVTGATATVTVDTIDHPLHRNLL
jgi:hypothetical protein